MKAQQVVSDAKSYRMGVEDGKLTAKGVVLAVLDALARADHGAQIGTRTHPFWDDVNAALRAYEAGDSNSSFQYGPGECLTKGGHVYATSTPGELCEWCGSTPQPIFPSMARDTESAGGAKVGVIRLEPDDSQSPHPSSD